MTLFCDWSFFTKIRKICRNSSLFYE